jgi:hypothetical protein
MNLCEGIYSSSGITLGGAGISGSGVSVKLYPPLECAEFVSSFGQSPAFDPLFREFVSSFGVAQPQGGVSVDGIPLSLDGDLITFN